MSTQTKTIIYLSTNTGMLESLDLDFYFPETKLHPREAVKLVPSLLGKSFCTHSEAILNQIGHLIEAKEVDCLSVEVRVISWVDYPAEEWQTLVSTFNERGYLIHWQFDFFEWSFN